MSKSLFVAVAAVVAGVVVACGAPASSFTPSTEDGGTGTGSAGGGAATFDADAGLSGLPCDVAALLRTRCISCHRTPLTGGATMPLTSRDELLAMSPIMGTYAARSLFRMRDTMAPMPPGNLPPATEVAAFEAWLNAGAPAGSCMAPVDAGVVTLTCASNRTWTDRYQGSGDMNPGMACRACHAGQNFNGQNPAGQSELGRQYWFGGTVFPGPNEKDGCLAAPPAGVSVEILDLDGGVRLTMPVRTSSGNFFNTTIRTAPTWLPYRARVRRNGVVVSTMTTPQMSGDCNLCHTERGEQGAPGRITW
ncbi:MAG: hypothetical protein JNJ54_13795 [Myxococcaceae bacterium]|nr:hypothetical protein [Myxococcaceae bacterium]